MILKTSIRKKPIQLLRLVIVALSVMGCMTIMWDSFLFMQPIGFVSFLFLFLTILFVVYFAVAEWNESGLFNERMQKKAMFQGNQVSLSVAKIEHFLEKISLEETVQSQVDLSVKEIESWLHPDRISLMLYDGEVLKIESSYGLSDEIVESTRVNPGDGIAGWVFINGIPLVINEEVDRDKFKNFQEKADKIFSSVCVPLKIGEKSIGVLSISITQSNKSFNQSDLRLISMIALMIASSLEKQRVLDDFKNDLRIAAA